MATQFSVNDHIPWKARFFTIWGGQALSIIGSQLVQFALIWYLTVQTGSATVLATASLVGLLPNVILGPFIGTLVDRWDRRRIMLVSDTVIALATIGMAGLFALDAVEIWQIYVVLFIRALFESFHSNAMTASTSLMVPVEHLTRVQGINQMLNGGLNVISAPIGALLLSILPMQGILAIDVFSALFAIVPLLFVRIPQPERHGSVAGDHGKETVWQGVKSGLRYVTGWPGLLIVSLMTVGINFTIIPAFSLMPLLVKEYFGGSAIHLGWVESAMGIGMFVGGAALGAWGGFKRNIVTSLLGLMGMGIGTLVFAAAPPTALWMAVIGSLLVGIMTPVTMGPFYAMIQTIVEPDMQARVFSLLSSAGTAMVPVGLLVAGPVADRFSIQVWFLFGGLLCIVMAVGGLFIPAVKQIESRETAMRGDVSQSMA
ncbi:MAG: MFS transporter [Candidatus Promineifilaceae bacterium]|jgi:MFS transporter, DHA3 family, macrolide efflux protein